MVSLHVLCFCVLFHRVEVSQKDPCSAFDVIGRASGDLVQVFWLDGSTVSDAQERHTPEVECLAEEVCLFEGELDSLVLGWNGRDPLV